MTTKTATRDAPKFAYLRNRPFLLISFYKVPANPSGVSRTRTERKGWMQDQRNLVTNEHPLIVDRVSDKQLVNSGIIIDIMAGKVIKNCLTNTADDVLTHYRAKYADIIERGRNMWIRQALGDLAAHRRQAMADGQEVVESPA